MRAVRATPLAVVNKVGAEGGVFTYEKREISLRVLTGGGQDMKRFRSSLYLGHLSLWGGDKTDLMDIALMNQMFKETLDLTSV